MINNCENRLELIDDRLLMELSDAFKVEVEVRGKQVDVVCGKELPLHVHVSSASKDCVDRASAEIRKMIVPEFRQIFNEVIKLDWEPDKGFPIQEQLCGENGDFIRHIITTTGVKLRLRGKGSGYIELDTQKEALCPLEFVVGSNDSKNMEDAKTLILSLCLHAKLKHDEWKKNSFLIPDPKLAMIPDFVKCKQDIEKYLKYYGQFYKHFHNLYSNADPQTLKKIIPKLPTNVDESRGPSI